MSHRVVFRIDPGPENVSLWDQRGYWFVRRKYSGLLGSDPKPMEDLPGRYGTQKDAIQAAKKIARRRPLDIIEVVNVDPASKTPPRGPSGISRPSR